MVSLNISSTPRAPFRITVTDVDELFVSDIVDLLKAADACRRSEIDEFGQPHLFADVEEVR